MATGTHEYRCLPESDEMKTATTFEPTDRTRDKPAVHLPDELWITILESTCTFPQNIFSEVMLNLIKNPNITSSHLFRADVFYDSSNDHNEALLKQLQRVYQPVHADLPGFECQRTIVRQLIPRNPQLDRPLIQTCHFISKSDTDDDHMIVLYIPHAERAEDIPFYHPAVARVAFEHRVNHFQACTSEIRRTSYSISISYSLFPSGVLTNKLERTALRLLETIHKHGQGQLAGYQKRMHHDQIVPQKRYQDTYTRLKTKYGKQLSEQWVEVTDPGKHVFEDLAIAAFLIELWQDMYRFSSLAGSALETENGGNSDAVKPQFLGFVDIGCGNGVLVYVLLAEGYEGWGFDARERKTWSIFPEFAQTRLQRKLLIPELFSQNKTVDEDCHNGIFECGTFIISNHADELTTWTPLLAYLNGSAFIAIPCCSHSLAGARFRAPPTTKSMKAAAVRLPQQEDKEDLDESTGDGSTKRQQAAETGSLKRIEAQNKMPSAYSTLCSYVTSLAAEVGFEPEHEVLRIPSTRNQSIVGRYKRKDLRESKQPEMDTKRQKVVDMVEREVGRSIDVIGADWIARAEKLAKKPGSGH